MVFTIVCMVIIMLAVMLGATMAVVAYRIGAQDGGREIKHYDMPHFGTKKDENTEDAEIARINALLKNVEEYDGTAAGQKAVL